MPEIRRGYSHERTSPPFPLFAGRAPGHRGSLGADLLHRHPAPQSSALAPLRWDWSDDERCLVLSMPPELSDGQHGLPPQSTRGEAKRQLRAVRGNRADVEQLHDLPQGVCPRNVTGRQRLAHQARRVRWPLRDASRGSNPKSRSAFFWGMSRQVRDRRDTQSAWIVSILQTVAEPGSGRDPLDSE